MNWQSMVTDKESIGSNYNGELASRTIGPKAGIK
jgi:hypothetical protein